MSDRLWEVFSGLCLLYRKVSCQQRGVYFVVLVERKGKLAAISEFVSGWWLELMKHSEPTVLEKPIETTDELLLAVREWLDH
jgi:hypothetical protein